MKYAIHVCSFSSAFDDLKKKDHSDEIKVLRALQAAGRVSTFEASDTPAIAKMMDDLQARKLIELDNSLGYPWHKVTVTEAGVNLIASSGEQKS